MAHVGQEFAFSCICHIGLCRGHFKLLVYLTEFHLCQLAFSNVGVAAAVALQDSIGVQDGDAVGGDPHIATILGLYDIFQILERFLTIYGREGGFLECLAFGFGMQIVEVHPAHQFIRAVAQNGLGYMTYMGVEAVGIYLPGDGAVLLGQLFEPLLALAQFLLGQPPFVDLLTQILIQLSKFQRSFRNAFLQLNMGIFQKCITVFCKIEQLGIFTYRHRHNGSGKPQKTIFHKKKHRLNAHCHHCIMSCKHYPE